MKDKFIKEQEKHLAENSIEWNFGPNNEPINDDCCGQECCHEDNAASASAYAAEYDTWWDSLTDDQKEQLFKDRDDSERDISDDDFFGPNKTMGI